MGVVRDVTIDQLTQAVQGISSAGMTDTTGQDIKDAIDTLDMTAGSLGKDSTLQDIVTAISGLGSTLGSDKANISGDNIVSTSTFRRNIGIPLDYVTKTATVSIASGYSYYDLCGALSLSKGLWLVTYWAEFQEKATGTRILVLSSSPNVNSDVTNCSRITANNNGTTYLTRFGNAVLFDGRANDSNIYLNASQDSGSTLSVRGSMRAIKLLS